MNPVNRNSGGRAHAVPQLAVFAASLLLAATGLLASSGAAAPTAALGETRIARWQGDKRAAFLLMFDDSCPSHWQVAVPELARRHLVATFYINPGKAEYQQFAQEWEEKLWKLGMVYGDHTMTHKGVINCTNADWEIGECARVIRRLVPGKPQRLLSYGQPGVKPGDWKITAAEEEALLKQHHLVNRPDFSGHGAVYHLKTAAEMLALADKAIGEAGLEYLVIHGVERITPNWGYQDFWALKQDILRELLDGLQARRDKGELWVTDHVSAHQYQTERAQSTVQVLETGEESFRLEVKCQADPQLYDLPLTLVTRLPAGWERAQVSQGTNSTVVPVENNSIRYEALPGAAPVTIKRMAR